MNLQSMHVRTASLAIAMLSLAAPALAQDPPPVTFENIRDAVPGRFFSPSATVADANTLHVGFESGADAFKACAPSTPPLSAAPCSITRVAMDTLSFVVRAPEGYYISKISYNQKATGAISRLADSRGASSLVVAGVPIDLGGPFGGAAQFPAGGGARLRSSEREFTDTQMTAVPISLTTGLFAYASDLGSARVELESASVTVEILPIVATPAKKTATIVVEGFTVTYDGDSHGATGTAFGPDGEDLSHQLEFDDTCSRMCRAAPSTGLSPPTKLTTATSGTAEVIINPAAATIAVTGFTGTYDGLPHRATGTATGISGIVGDLNAHLDLGADVQRRTGRHRHVGLRRRPELSGGHRHGRDHHQQGDAGADLAATGGDSGRHRAFHGAAQRDCERLRRVRLHTATGNRAGRGDPHACRWPSRLPTR